MLCEECGKNQATIHLRSVVNGQQTERHLCESCMRAINPGMLEPFTLSGLLSGFMMDSGAHAPAQSEESQLRCARCGMTYNMFRKGGMLGCADCYEAFRERLTPMLKRMQAGIVHTGKRPSGAQAAKHEGISEKQLMDRLQEELQAAIRDELFERAAQIRDQIKDLKLRQGEDDAVG